MLLRTQGSRDQSMQRGFRLSSPDMLDPSVTVRQFFMGLWPCILFACLKRCVLVGILFQNKLVTGVFFLLDNSREEVRILLCCIEACSRCSDSYFDSFGQVVLDLESTEQTSTGTELAFLHAEFPLHVLVERRCPFLDLFEAERKVFVDTIPYPSCQQLLHL